MHGHGNVSFTRCLRRDSYYANVDAFACMQELSLTRSENQVRVYETQRSAVEERLKTLTSQQQPQQQQQQAATPWGGGGMSSAAGRTDTSAAGRMGVAPSTSASGGCATYGKGG